MANIASPDEPKELPERVVVVAMNDDIKGQRQFIIIKNVSYPYDESDTYDDVKVGTLMIQNGYTCTAGKVICGGEPKLKMTEICIPPPICNDISRPYPFELRDEDELYFAYQKSIREDFEVSI
ncbi:hypothetical protein OROMI_004238 [Orobanche minor]